MDIARQALSCTVVIGEPGAVPDGLSGALIPIVSKLDPVQIGLFSTDEGCEGLARALLGSSPGEKVTRPEVVDALGEIVTGLLYVDESAEDLHRHLTTVEVPLNQLEDSELCPGSALLEALNASLR